MEQGALVANLIATLLMTGVIWFVQIVHYPFFAFYRDEAFSRHAHRTAYVVTAFLLLIYRPTNPLFWAGALLVGLIWFSTNFLQIPRHAQLEAGFDQSAPRGLVKSNWLRTGAWTARSALMVWAISGAHLGNS